jgi:hypothetical protein
MGGYITLTTHDWIQSIKNLNNGKAVFWCKKKNFKAVCAGEPIYFV